MMVVTTSLGNVLTYSIPKSTSAKEVAVFTYSDNSPLFIYEGQLIRTAFPGPGEAAGVQEMFLQFKMIIKIESGLSVATALDNDLMIATKTPPAVQLVRWNANEEHTHEKEQERCETGKSHVFKHHTFTVILDQLSWISCHYQSQQSQIPMIIHSIWNKPMRLFIWILSDGTVWVVTMKSTLDIQDRDEQVFDGHRLHKPDSVSMEGFATCAEVNARFSLVAVGCSSGRIYLYNVKDYSGNFVLVKVLEPPSPSSGRVNVLSCSSDGYGWFVGYDYGWAFFSVFGMLNASSFISSADQRFKEKWMDGITQAAWSFSGDAVYILPKSKDSIWLLDILKWNATGNFLENNISNAVLYKDSKIMMYRGQDQPDLNTIDKDALLWLNVPIPASYIAENWPIKYVSCSSDGNFVAVAGVRGITHYSLNSGRWKLFVEEDADKEFTVRGGIVWYGNILITAVDTGVRHEIHMYLRELDLDSQNILYQLELPAAVINMFSLGNSLMVYTTSNHLYQYNILIQDRQIALELVSEISFAGIIHAPSRVRSISCLPNVDYKKSPLLLTDCNVLLLIDGMLIHLVPKYSNKANAPDSASEMKYRFKILHNYIEYYSISNSTGDIKNMIWAFDGQHIITWVNGTQGAIGQSQDSIPPSFTPMDLYPLTMLPDKGIVMGVECDAVLTRSGSFTYFKQWTSAQLFLPYILESYISANKTESALSIVKNYQHLKYFDHMLEVLLYEVLVNHSSMPGDIEESNTDQSSSAENDSLTLLRNTIDLISKFPQMPEIIVGCTRKTEIKYWKRLFAVLGSPQKLFDQCMESGKLVTAGSCLLVLHNMDQLDTKKKTEEIDTSTDTMKNTAELLRAAHEAQNWELCKELIRFVRSIEPSGLLLKKILSSANVIKE